MTPQSVDAADSLVHADRRIASLPLDPHASRRAAGWALAGVVAAVLPWLAYFQFALSGSWTALYLTSAEFYQASVLHDAYPPGTFQTVERPYDSQYFLALANDPLLRDHAARPNDSGWVFYRARRILWPWAGFVFALGQPRAILISLVAVQFLLLALTLWVLARTLAEHGLHPAWCLLHATALGTAICVIRPLSDLFATNLLILGAASRARNRDLPAAALFALAALARETTLLVSLCFALERLHQRDWRRLAPYLLVPLVMALWWAYVASRISTTALDVRNIGPPFIALARRLGWPPGTRGLVEAAAIGAVVIALAGVFVASRASWDLWRWSILPSAVLMLMGSRHIWYDYWSYGRVSMVLPALLLWRFAVRGQNADLAGPIASSCVGLLVWYASLGHTHGIARLFSTLGHALQ